MRVLIDCETSGRSREAWRKRGHDAWSCDLLPPDDGSHFHYQCDARRALKFQDWDALIAHPPCTRLTNSGVCWLHSRNLWHELDEACELFKALLDAPIPRIAIENPIPHKYAVERIGRKYDQIIQPYQFGHPERKATCLWLKGFPHLRSTNVVPLPKDKRLAQRMHWLPPSPDRWKLRSVTFQGIANAMAEQWGNL